MNPAEENHLTIAECIEQVASRFADAGLFFGHGTETARDEAAWLVLHVLEFPLDGSFQDWGQTVSADSFRHISELAERRCNTREPLAYILGSAWFAGLEFRVSPDVLVPRSPLAELILDGFQPWCNPAESLEVLDMCTGSACIAIATAHYLPGAHVDAVDISAAALRVARENVLHHRMENRVRLIQSDLFEALEPALYGLIVSNPPYVAEDSLEQVSNEYRQEPELGLVSGADGLYAVLRILLDAPRFLREDGVLVCEVGESENRLQTALPDTPFLWLEFERGGSGVFLLDHAELLRTQAAVKELIEKRRHVT